MVFAVMSESDLELVYKEIFGVSASSLVIGEKMMIKAIREHCIKLQNSKKIIF